MSARSFLQRVCCELFIWWIYSVRISFYMWTRLAFCIFTPWSCFLFLYQKFCVIEVTVTFEKTFLARLCKSNRYADRCFPVNQFFFTLEVGHGVVIDHSNFEHFSLSCPPSAHNCSTPMLWPLLPFNLLLTCDPSPLFSSILACTTTSHHTLSRLASLNFSFYENTH